MIESVCRPGALDSCRPVWDVVPVSSDLDQLLLIGLTILTWAVIAASFVGAAVLIETLISMRKGQHEN